MIGAPELGASLQQPSAPGLETAPLQVVFVALAAATWMIGVILLIARHHRRMGRPPWAVFSLLAPSFRNFNASEWRLFAAIVVLTLAFAAIAIALGS